jgi:hypothetical protein
LAFANMLKGRLAVRAGRAEEGIAVLEATAANMRRAGVGFYADLASALVAEAQAVGGVAEQGLQMAERLLAAGSTYVSLLRRACGSALLRMGDTEAAQRELELAVEAARERGEDYEVALALDALACIEPLDAARQLNRDMIVERLGIVQLPALAGLANGAPAAEQPAELSRA